MPNYPGSLGLWGRTVSQVPTHSEALNPLWAEPTEDGLQTPLTTAPGILMPSFSLWGHCTHMQKPHTPIHWNKVNLSLKRKRKETCMGSSRKQHGTYFSSRHSFPWSMFFTVLVLFPLLTQFKPYRRGIIVFWIHVANYCTVITSYINWVQNLPQAGGGGTRL